MRTIWHANEAARVGGILRARDVATVDEGALIRGRAMQLWAKSRAEEESINEAEANRRCEHSHSILAVVCNRANLSVAGSPDYAEFWRDRTKNRPMHFTPPLSSSPTLHQPTTLGAPRDVRVDRLRLFVHSTQLTTSVDGYVHLPAAAYPRWSPVILSVPSRAVAPAAVAPVAVTPAIVAPAAVAPAAVALPVVPPPAVALPVVLPPAVAPPAVAPAAVVPPAQRPDLECWEDNKPSGPDVKLPQRCRIRLAGVIDAPLLRNGFMTTKEHAIPTLFDLLVVSSDLVEDPKLKGNDAALRDLNGLLFRLKTKRTRWTEESCRGFREGRLFRASVIQQPGKEQWDGISMVDHHYSFLEPGQLERKILVGEEQGPMVQTTFPVQAQHFAGHPSSTRNLERYQLCELKDIYTPWRLALTAAIYAACGRMVPNFGRSASWHDSVSASRHASIATDAHDARQEEIAISSTELFALSHAQVILLAQTANRTWFFKCLAPTHKLLITTQVNGTTRTTTKYIWLQFKSKDWGERRSAMIPLEPSEVEEYLDDHVFDVTGLRPLRTPLLFVRNLFGRGEDVLVAFSPHLCVAHPGRQPFQQFQQGVNSIESSYWTLSSLLPPDVATLDSYRDYRIALDPLSDMATQLNKEFNFYAKGVETLDPNSPKVINQIFQLRAKETSTGIVITPDSMARPLLHTIASLVDVTVPPSHIPSNPDHSASHTHDFIIILQSYKLCNLARDQLAILEAKGIITPDLEAASQRLQEVQEKGTWEPLMEELGMTEMQMQGPSCFIIACAGRQARQNRANHTIENFAAQSLGSLFRPPNTSFPRHFFSRHTASSLAIADGGNRRMITGFFTRKSGGITANVGKLSLQFKKTTRTFQEGTRCDECAGSGSEVDCCAPYLDAIPFLVREYGVAMVIEVLQVWSAEFVERAEEHSQFAVDLFELNRLYREIIVDLELVHGAAVDKMTGGCFDV